MGAVMPNGYVVWPATTVFLLLPDYRMPTLCNAPRHNYDVFHPVAVMYEQEYRNNIMQVCLMYVAICGPRHSFTCMSDAMGTRSVAKRDTINISKLIRDDLYQSMNYYNFI